MESIFCTTKLQNHKAATWLRIPPRRQPDAIQACHASACCSVLAWLASICIHPFIHLPRLCNGSQYQLPAAEGALLPAPAPAHAGWNEPVDPHPAPPLPPPDVGAASCTPDCTASVDASASASGKYGYECTLTCTDPWVTGTCSQARVVQTRAGHAKLAASPHGAGGSLIDAAGALCQVLTARR